jgi:hypothetical protein
MVAAGGKLRIIMGVVAGSGGGKVLLAARPGSGRCEKPPMLAALE